MIRVWSTANKILPLRPGEHVGDYDSILQDNRAGLSLWLPSPTLEFLRTHIKDSTPPQP